MNVSRYAGRIRSYRYRDTAPPRARHPSFQFGGTSLFAAGCRRVDLVQLASIFCDQVRSGLDPFFGLERLRQIAGAVAGANLAVGY